MNVSCQLFIDGTFEGSIISDKEINIGHNGHVIGEVTTDRLIIQGNVEGNVNANKVEIKASGRVNGTIESVELLIESKGIFEGSSILKKEDMTAIASKPLADKKSK